MVRPWRSQVASRQFQTANRRPHDVAKSLVALIWIRVQGLPQSEVQGYPLPTIWLSQFILKPTKFGTAESGLFGSPCQFGILRTDPPCPYESASRCGTCMTNDFDGGSGSRRVRADGWDAQADLRISSLANIQVTRQRTGTWSAKRSHASGSFRESDRRSCRRFAGLRRATAPWSSRLRSPQ